MMMKCCVVNCCGVEAEWSHGYVARIEIQGRVVRKPVNGNPGLKVNRHINFSCIKMFFTCYISCKVRLLKLKTKGQTI